MVGAYGSGFRACGGYGSRRGTAVRLSESSPHRLSIATRSGYRCRPFRPLSRSSARLGYVEGKNITIGWRVAQENFDRVREFADELVRLKVDVIASPGPTVTRIVKDVTSTIPTVMAHDTDPSAAGSSPVLRPGENITGLATLASEMGGKQLDLLREIVPPILATSSSSLLILNAAKKIGLAVPRKVLARAEQGDQMIGETEKYDE
jgi:hypothetical protein